MQCFTELVPPTAATQAICFPFTNATSNNLIVARTSLLQIFNLKNISTDVDATCVEGSVLTDRGFTNSDHQAQFSINENVTSQKVDRHSLTKPILITECKISGTITALARIKIPHSKSGGEALLVATKDAKLSLVEWDIDLHSISTISIHLYEQEDLQTSPWAPELSQCVSYLTADPSSRCAALLFGSRNLAILPFHLPGDDLVMDDADGDAITEWRAGMARLQGIVDTKKRTVTPYNASFVLPLSALDVGLLHPIHLAFLYEYREPTFGVLSSTVAPSASLLQERRDVLSYTVFTLDLEQRASTTILSVTNLPYDLHRVIPLPTPVGGTLLIGGNEIIHVDQAGKTNGVAVNMFAKLASSFGMADQSDLKMKLEDCVIEQLGIENGEMLLVLNTGELAIISFKLDGRSISGLSVRRVSEDQGGLIMKAGASCSAHLSRGRLFIGSEETDSVVLGWSQGSKQATTLVSSITGENDDDDNGERFDSDQSDDNDDDLYAERPNDQGQRKASLSATAASKTGDYTFRIHTSLLNIAPIKNITFGQIISGSVEKGESADDDIAPSLEIAAAIGHGRAGGVAFLRQEIKCKDIESFDFPEAHGIWSIQLKRPPSLSASVGDNVEAEHQRENDAIEEFDRFVVVSRSAAEGGEESVVYAINSTVFEEVKGTEFEPEAGGTIEMGTLGNGTRMVQVLPGEVRSYDSALGLAQIYPMTDELTGLEPKVVSASFADPYALLVRDDASILLLQCVENGDLEEVERTDSLLASKWLSGCLYEDRDSVFTPAVIRAGSKTKARSTAMFLLSAQGGLHLYVLPRMVNPFYVADSLSFLHPMLFCSALEEKLGARRSTASNREAITEILVANLGDSVATSPFLILRSSNDDLTIYKPYNTRYNFPDLPPSSRLRFLKVPNHSFARPPLDRSTVGEDDEPIVEERNPPLRAIKNIGGYSTVFIPGSSPSFILKSSTSIPRVLRLSGTAVRNLSGFHTSGCSAGWVAIDTSGVAKICQFPSDVDLTETGWVVRRLQIGRSVDDLTYHSHMSCYVLVVSEDVPYTLPPKDDTENDHPVEATIDLPPTTPQSTIILLSTPSYETIYTFPLRPHETVLTLTTLYLVTSEHHPNSRTELICLGTTIPPAPLSPATGAVMIFNVIPCVPFPGRPSTDRKLRLITREEVKGAVTALSPIGSQGFLVVGQGQKLLVRGLKEDGRLMPVAFMDVGCYVTSLRNLPGTGLTVMGDAVRGVGVVGYMEEPYKLVLFGKSANKVETTAVEFLPDGRSLFIIVADAEGNLHTLQFDPEHPKSLLGTRLLHHSSFSTGAQTTTLTRLPSSLAPSTYQVLHTSSTGAISLITPLSESAYRRLSTLSNALASSVERPLGLNPRAYRLASGTVKIGVEMGIGMGSSIGGGGGRNMVDGNTLTKWMELSVQRRNEMLARVGTGEQELRADIMVVAGAGLDYL